MYLFYFRTMANIFYGVVSGKSMKMTRRPTEED